jgi:hypothetical protein
MWGAQKSGALLLRLRLRRGVGEGAGGRRQEAVFEAAVMMMQ